MFTLDAMMLVSVKVCLLIVLQWRIFEKAIKIETGIDVESGVRERESEVFRGGVVDDSNCRRRSPPFMQVPSTWERQCKEIYYFWA